ncbi:MAG: PilN domain-containing protein [candidate division Zixibacteria bacterium]|nr:PilN domain-containing protein [candidate division Zixibacteria bacterium]
MITINLLPKQYRRKSISLSFGKTGLYGIGVAAGIIIMMISITFYQMHQISKLEENTAKAHQRAAMLQKDIQLVDGLTDVKEKIRARMAAVEKLDSHRSAWIRILENISHNVPEFVWLARFIEHEPPKVDSSATKGKTPSTPVNNRVRKAEIEGYTFTLNALASFMINMMRSDYFDNVEMKSTSEKMFGDQKAYNFVLSCNLHYLSDENLRGLIANAYQQNDTKNSATQKSLN